MRVRSRNLNGTLVGSWRDPACQAGRARGKDHGKHWKTGVGVQVSSCILVLYVIVIWVSEIRLLRHTGEGLLQLTSFFFHPFCFGHTKICRDWSSCFSPAPKNSPLHSTPRRRLEANERFLQLERSPTAQQGALLRGGVELGSTAQDTRRDDWGELEVHGAYLDGHKVSGESTESLHLYHLKAFSMLDVVKTLFASHSDWTDSGEATKNPSLGHSNGKRSFPPVVPRGRDTPRWDPPNHRSSGSAAVPCSEIKEKDGG